MHAFTGKTLVVDLSSREHHILKRDEAFYRAHIGGGLLAARLLQEHLPESGEVDALGPDNPLIFATGPLAGGKIAGSTRVNVLAVSPETPGIYLTQAGGDFGPNLKRSGLDALVIKGVAADPVTLHLTFKEGEPVCEIRDATALWGLDRGETDERLRAALGRGHTIASIGPAGEACVPSANIMFETDHYAGRGGMGAVMGAKRLKAISVGGEAEIAFYDPKAVRAVNKAGAASFRALSEDSFNKGLAAMGTFSLIAGNNSGGNLPVLNFAFAQEVDPDFVEEISHAQISEIYVGKNNPCRACFLTCKKKDRADPERTSLAEYESVALLGPNLGLKTSLEEGLQAAELCNLLGLDTISTGNQIGWLMDCFENGALDPEQIGAEIHFGDRDGVLELIEDIAHAQGPLGGLLAKGVEAAATALGAQTRPYLRFSKGVGLPAHLPRKKPGIGFGYLHGPNPGDHMKLEHDWIAADEDSLRNLGLEGALSAGGALDDNKVRVAHKTQIYYAMIDTLSLCMFVFGPGNTYTFAQIAEMVQAATGMDLSFDELMQLGERSIQLQRALHLRLGGEDEALPAFMQKPIPEGPSAGMKIDAEDFAKTRQLYYELWGWDEMGRPKAETLQAVGL